MRDRERNPRRPAALGQPVSEQSGLRRDVLDRIGAGVAIVDPRTRVIEWVNPTAAELLGAPAEQIAGQKCHRLLCSAEEEECPVLDRDKEVDNAERTLLRRDGRDLTVVKSVKRVCIDGEEKLLETFIDISERKRVEQNRRESEDRYRALFETSSDAMMVLAPPDWSFISANAATLELFGVKDEETFKAFAPWQVSPATQPDGRPSSDKAREMIAIAMRQGSHSFEWRHQRRDGREIPASVLLTRLVLGGQTLLQATVRDLRPIELALSALRDSEERLRLAVEATGMGTYLLDHATGKANHSPELLSLYDVPPDGTLPLGPDLVPLAVLDEDRQVFRAAVAASNEPSGDGVLKVEFRVRRPDGSIRWLMARGRTEFEDVPGERRPSRAAGIIMDITERRQAEEMLRRYELLAAHSRDMVLFVRRDDGCILNANASALATYGYTRDEMLSLSIQHLRAPEARLLTEEQMALADSVGVRFETVHQRRDRGAFPVEVSSVGATIGGVRTLMSVVRDISERRQAEAALRESEERFRASFMTGLDAVFWASLHDGRILEVNRVFEGLYGYFRDEAIGRTAEQLGLYCNPDDRSRMLSELEEKGFVRDLEMKARRKDGQLITVSFSASLVRSSNQQFFLGIVRDITERKRAEEETAKLTLQLQQAQKMESVGRLAGGVAHDFNNMLGVILGYSELALEKIGASDPLHDDLTNIRTAAQRSAALTNQLLAFARKQTVAPRVLNLNHTVSGLLKMVRRLIGEDIELRWRPGENVWPVKVDPTQLDQILANLCVNARDAIANVGTIVIETGSKVIPAHAATTSNGTLPGDYVWLTVSDDGCGMAPSTLAHAFEPFFTTKDAGKGTGLGLSTVYGIVKQNGGFIELRSELAQGTAVTLYLPRHVGKEVDDGTHATAGIVQPGQETILLVEDEAPLLEVTQRMLEKRGYRVLPAGTPERAIQLAREHGGDIDLLVTDVVMPKMNGRDLAKSFSSLHPRAKRLFMSGHTAEVIAQGILDRGVFFIQKPFSAKDLAAMVRRVLDAGSADAA